MVCALLQAHWHIGLRLVDTRAEGLLPGLRSRKGLSDWRCDPEVFIVGETDEAVRRESLSRLPELVPSMLPPSPEDASRLHLERCHRILPQDNDTGGFFVAVLELQDCTVMDSTELGHFQGRVAGGRKKKAAKESSASVHVMKELGYNPKRKGQVSASTATSKAGKKGKEGAQRVSKRVREDVAASTSTVIDPPNYQPVDASDLTNICDALHLFHSHPNTSASITCGDNDSASGEISGTALRMVTATSEKAEAEVVSLVSANVLEALLTWAQQVPSLVSAAPGLLVHAGVPVASIAHSDPDQCSLVADGVPSLLPWIKRGTMDRSSEGGSANIATMSADDFRSLCMLRSAATGEVRLGGDMGVLEGLLLAVQDVDIQQVQLAASTRLVVVSWRRLLCFGV